MKRLFICLLVILPAYEIFARVPEMYFKIDDNSNPAPTYVVKAFRISHNDPLFGLNFMEVDDTNNIYDEIHSEDNAGMQQPLGDFEYIRGFNFLRCAGAFPEIGEGKIRFEIFRNSLLSENDIVNFRVELVNQQTEEIVGTFDDITYSIDQLEKYDNISYQVDCSNITPGEYYLRLVTTVQGDAGYYLGKVQNNSGSLNKRNYQKINFDGKILPTIYELSQNFPNPFNPSTTINYQVPKNSFITLKVYDILGREVATLVNEQKNQGRYSVNFNASSLASGIYIYQIRTNDFVSSRKMMLVK